MKKKHTDLTKEEILHLAKLANLPLSDEEMKKYQEQLAETISYVENLKELDTSNVKPSATSAKLENVFFSDGEKNDRNLSQNEATMNAKQKKHGYFKVGRIM